MNRDDYNIQPNGDLVEIMGDFPFRVFRDEVTLQVYVRVNNTFSFVTMWLQNLFRMVLLYSIKLV